MANIGGDLTHNRPILPETDSMSISALETLSSIVRHAVASDRYCQVVEAYFMLQWLKTEVLSRSVERGSGGDFLVVDSDLLDAIAIRHTGIPRRQ